MRSGDERHKRSHASVKFEHPARGPHHCTECQNFRAPSSCTKVVRPIARGDWCQLFAPKSIRADVERAAEKY